MSISANSATSADSDVSVLMAPSVLSVTLVCTLMPWWVSSQETGLAVPTSVLTAGSIGSMAGSFHVDCFVRALYQYGRPLFAVCGVHSTMCWDIFNFFNFQQHTIMYNYYVIYTSIIIRWYDTRISESPALPTLRLSRPIRPTYRYVLCFCLSPPALKL